MAYSEDEIETKFRLILEDLEDGKSLRQSLKQQELSSRTFFKWIDNDDEKVKQYARATELRADVIFEEILEISDTTEEGVTIKETDKGIETTKGDMIQHRRLKVDARKWILGKMNPKKYGDSSLLKLGGHDGDALKINALFTKDLLDVPSNDGTEEDSES